MGTQVTLTVPRRLYQRVQRLAEQRHKDLLDVLSEAIQLAEATTKQEDMEEAAMAQEEAAYYAMYEEVWAKHAGEYVAIYQENLVDYDIEEIALLQRINEKYPNEIVLMKRVLPLPEPELHFRSPRFVEE